jgi:two-component system cell cycle sensor histidine kinase PleC
MGTGDGLKSLRPGEAAWLIAPTRGLVLAATPVGADLLGMAVIDAGRPTSLDRSMPALRELTLLLQSSDGRNGKEVERNLVLWTASGPSTIRCSCTRSGDISDALIVRAFPLEPVSPAPSEPDTGATLSKIADRIRSELRTRSGTTPNGPSDPVFLRPGAGRAEQIGNPAAVGLPPPGPVSPGAGKANAQAHQVEQMEGAGSASLPPPQPHLAKLAHELRTPVAAIASMAEIMRDERFGPLADSRYVDYARSIYDSARHMLAVIESMLDRPVSGSDSQPLTFVDLDLDSLAESAATALRPLASASALTIQTSPTAGLPKVVADQRCVRQIVLNLLTNAMKFTPGGGTVRIATGYAPGTSLWLEISDSGPGMAADQVERLRTGLPASPAPSRSPQIATGQGLGLPLVHALAAANGARVEIASRPGAGTHVRLVFPADRMVLV